MDGLAVAMAKLAGVSKAVAALLTERLEERDRPRVRYFPPARVAHYFETAAREVNNLRTLASNWFGDFQQISVKPDTPMGEERGSYFSRGQVETLARDIDQIFELRASVQHATPQVHVAPRRVFITHGRSRDWYDVQSHIEHDLGLKTMELSQEASKGKTIIEKLESGTTDCDSAVIIMSGDDTDGDGTPRVRENVMHEIGYFHGAYGRSQVVLLHEEGVSVPTNLGGIVYVAYPKGFVKATFGELDRELRAIYKLL